MIPSSSSLAKLYLMQLAAIKFPLSEDRVLDLSLGCYLLETADGGHILIDTGMAPEAKSSFVPRSPDETNVIGQLSLLGLSPANIETVICTHFDIDHAGYHDVFTKAEFIVQGSHYSLARSGHPRFAGARPHWDHPSLRYRLVDGDTDLIPGLSLLETSGHVPGHQSVLLRLPRTGTVLLAIDAVAMQRLFTTERKAWPQDDDEDQLRASTKKLLTVVERENVSLVVFGHDGAQWKSLRKSPDFYD